MRDAQTKGATAWHQQWSEASNVIESKPALYLAGGFSTDEEFYEAILGETRQTAIRCMRIMKLTTPIEVASYRPTKLDLAIRYIEATSKKVLETRDDVDFTKVSVQLTVAGKKVTKSLKEVTTVELRDALSQLMVRPKKKVSADMKLVLELLKRSGVEGVKATMVGGSFNIRVPVDGLKAVAKELFDFEPSDKS